MVCGGFAMPTAGGSFTGTVATVYDDDPNAAAGDYTATIQWGDGQASPGVIADDGLGDGGFYVTGSHVYGTEGDYVTTITVTDIEAAGSGVQEGTATAYGTAEVLDAPSTATGGLSQFSSDENGTVPFASLAAVPGTELDNVLLARFTDADPNGAAGDYSASIDWGDGNATAGAVAADAANGGFDVLGTYSYSDPGSYWVECTITDSGGATAVVDSTAWVSDLPTVAAPASAAPSPVAGTTTVLSVLGADADTGEGRNEEECKT